MVRRGGKSLPGNDLWVFGREGSIPADFTGPQGPDLVEFGTGPWKWPILGQLWTPQRQPNLLDSEAAQVIGTPPTPIDLAATPSSLI